jgi:hypothetical protein
MEDINKIAMKLFHAYEDFYLDKEKREFFEKLFDEYLAKVDSNGTMEVYDAVIALAQQNRTEFDQMIGLLREKSLLPE